MFVTRSDRGGHACAFHLAPGEAQPKLLSGPHHRLAAEEPRQRGQTGYVTLCGFALHITKNTGSLPFGHQMSIPLSQDSFLPRGLREASPPCGMVLGLPAPGASQGVLRGAKAMPGLLFLSWLNEIILRSASHVTGSVRPSSPKVKASFVTGFS